MVTHTSERLSIPRTVAEHRARLCAVAVEGGRVTYVDEGPANGDIMLLLHGMPTNSWMWRKLIPRLSAASLRVIAPDMLGFGASDKPKTSRRTLPPIPPSVRPNASSLCLTRFMPSA